MSHLLLRCENCPDSPCLISRPMDVEEYEQAKCPKGIKSDFEPVNKNLDTWFERQHQ